MISSRFHCLVYDTLDSTNEEAKRLLNAGAIHAPSVIRARRQTAGKGSQGRQWISPPDSGLYLSIVHPLSESELRPIPLTPLFTLAAGVACAETLRAMAGLEIQLKPINDLYAEGCKLGGILTESLLGQESGQPVCKALITGIGINVFEHADVQSGCEQEARGNRPTSLQACIPPLIFDRWHGDSLMAELSLALAEAVDSRYQQLIAGETDALLDAYIAHKIPHLPLPTELAHLAIRS